MMFQSNESLFFITVVFALYAKVSRQLMTTALFKKDISHLAIDDFGNAYVAIESSVHVVNKDMHQQVVWNVPATSEMKQYVEPIKFLAVKNFKNESFLIVCAKTELMVCYRLSIKTSYESKTVHHEQLSPPLQSIYRFSHTDDGHYEFFLDKAEPYPCGPTTAFTKEIIAQSFEERAAAANLFCLNDVSHFVESRYVYHFKHGNYAYFLKVFATKIENESHDRMVLTRISNRREYIDSYTEIPLSSFTAIRLTHFGIRTEHCDFVKFVSADFGRMNQVQKEMVKTKTGREVKGDYALFLGVLCSTKERRYSTELFFISMDEVNLIVEGEYRKFRGETSSTWQNFDLFAISKNNGSAFECVNISDTLPRHCIKSTNMYSIDALEVFQSSGYGIGLVRFKTLSRDQQSIVIVYADNLKVFLLRVSDGKHLTSDWFYIRPRKKVKLNDYDMKKITQKPLDFTPGKIDKNGNYAFIASGQELLKINVGSPCPSMTSQRRCQAVNKGLFAQCIWCMSKCVRREDCDMSVFDDLKYPRIVDAWPLEFATGGTIDLDIAIEHDQNSLHCPSKAIIVGEINVRCGNYQTRSSFTRQNKTITLGRCQCESFGPQLSHKEPKKFSIQGIGASNSTLEFNGTFSVAKVVAKYAALKISEDQNNGLLAICGEHMKAIYDQRRRGYNGLELAIYNESCICVNFKCESELHLFEEPEAYIWSNSPITSNAHFDITGNSLVLGNGSLQNIRDIVLGITSGNLTPSDNVNDIICQTVNWPLIMKSPTDVPPKTSKKLTSPWEISFIVIITVLIMIIPLQLIILRFIKRKQRTSPLPSENIAMVGNFSAFGTNELADLIALSGVQLINPSMIEHSSQIGTGQFGIVYKASLRSAHGTVFVAIKSPLSAQPEEMNLFVREALRMLHFDHKNVTSLIGLTLINGAPNIVMAFEANGDLLRYIKNHSNCPDMNIRLRFSRDIASGMEYLTNQGIVHRDLAARNCMLDEHLNVKVADFGLSRSLYGQPAYIRKNMDLKMPLAWMAPETLTLFLFNETTDVWSYGVTLWEIFTGGEVPYGNLSYEAVWRLIESGKKLPLDFVTSEMQGILLQCWQKNPLERPTFSRLLHMLQEISFPAPITGYAQYC